MYRAGESEIIARPIPHTWCHRMNIQSVQYAKKIHTPGVYRYMQTKFGFYLRSLLHLIVFLEGEEVFSSSSSSSPSSSFCFK